MDEMVGVIGKLRAFVAEREWEQFHDPKNLAMAVASEAGELLAEFRWVKNGEADVFAKSEVSYQRISDEVADVGISLLLFCDRVGIDFTEAIKSKLEMNRKNYPIEKSKGRSERPDR